MCWFFYSSGTITNGGPNSDFFIDMDKTDKAVGIVDGRLKSETLKTVWRQTNVKDERAYRAEWIMVHLVYVYFLTWQ